MANGGGGSIVLGVKDTTLARNRAVVGVPVNLDTNRLKRAI
jgi:ATP-dependent DNA helicase RecG